MEGNQGEAARMELEILSYAIDVESDKDTMTL